MPEILQNALHYLLFMEIPYIPSFVAENIQSQRS